MNIGLFEDSGYRGLLPLVWLRPVFELWCGADRLIDRVQPATPGRVVKLWTRPTLDRTTAERYRLPAADPAADWLLLNGRALITGPLPELRPGSAWTENGSLIAARISSAEAATLDAALFLDDARAREWRAHFDVAATPETVELVSYPWQLVAANARELKRQLRGGAHEGKVHPGAHLLAPERIRIEAGAVIKPGAVLDAEAGPIQIGAAALIEPNAVIEGPAYIGTKSIVRPNSVIRLGTSIGPVCKVGGEIADSILQGYSNKQHDGFLGHSYVGSWVNFGAGTITSDLKNTYGAIRAYVNGTGVETGVHFLGTIIGDHSKTGIGTILPTGCIIGIASNVFTPAAAARFVPSFAWVTADGATAYRLDKALDIARIVMGRRNIELSAAEEALFRAAAFEAPQIEAAGWGALQDGPAARKSG